jgi:putative heme iron utilization protein
MAADPITPEVSQRICKHMNEDHAEAVLVYAKVYGQTEDATAAAMKAIDPEGMDLEVTLNSEIAPLRIPFDHQLTDSEDAHQTLIGMIRQARTPQA